MFTASPIYLMAEYSRFMNERLYAAAAELSDEERGRERGAFFGSIHATLEHILWADMIWMGRFDGVVRTLKRVREPLYDDFEEMHRERRRFDEEILEYARGLDRAALDAPIEWRSRIYDVRKVHPRWVYMLHMFNHGTHHRGQITTLLSQMGVDIGATDLPVTPILLEMG